MSAIKVGMDCWIIRTSPGNEDLLGRVVEVVSPALPLAQRGGVPMHEIDAPWLRADHPRCHCFAAPAQLLPIAGPSKPPLATRKREPEHA